MERDSFVFYRSFFESIQEYDDEQFARCVRALLNLSLNGVEYTGDDVITRLFIAMAKPQIEKNNKRYENGKKGGKYGVQGADYGKLGGRPKKENPPKTPQKPP